MNTTNDVHFTTEIFPDRETAEKAYQHAIDSGYAPKDINVLMSDESREKYYGSVLVKEGSKASTGLGIGGSAGAAIGGICAALAAIGTNLILPGMGLVVAGPLAAGLAGVGAGSIAGGIVGALIGWGIPEDRAKSFETGIKSGGIVLGVKDTLPDSQLASSWGKNLL